MKKSSKVIFGETVVTVSGKKYVSGLTDQQARQKAEERNLDGFFSFKKHPTDPTLMILVRYGLPRSPLPYSSGMKRKGED